MRRLRRLIGLLRLFWAQRFGGLFPPVEPHFDDAATVEFRRLLEAAHLYLEYGAGGSTLLATRLGIETVSIESDRFYARAVERALPQTANARVIAVDIGVTGEWGMPILKRPTSRRLARWAAYPVAPFADERGISAGRFPDLVLVDGRFRVACALAVARHAGLAGSATTLCFDDYYDERPHFHSVEAWIGAPRRVGRMAVFAIDGSRPVPDGAVLEAARDYR